MQGTYQKLRCFFGFSPAGVVLGRAEDSGRVWYAATGKPAPELAGMIVFGDAILRKSECLVKLRGCVKHFYRLGGQFLPYMGHDWQYRLD